MKKMKKFSTLLILCCFCLLVSACSQNEPTSSITSNSGTTLTYGSDDYTRINPIIDEHGEINALIFDGLLDRDENNKIVPSLAKSWDYNEKTHTYTFHLQDDVKWHDGEYFSAEDVKFTLEAIKDPANESAIASNYEDIQNIEIIDPLTLEITLQQTNAAFLNYLTNPIVPKHLLEGEDLQLSNYFKFPIGTGPYKLKEWDEGQSIQLEKNENYFKGLPNIDTVIFKITPDDNVKALQLKAGEIDLALIPPSLAEPMRSVPNMTIHQLQTADYRGIMYNFNHPFWQKHRELIKALNYAFDRQAMVDSVLLGQGDIAKGPLQKNIYHDDSVEAFNYNPKKAEQLIEQDGWTKGSDGYYEKNGERLSFELTVSENQQERLDLATIAAQQLKEIGVECIINVTANVDWDNQAAYLIGWGSPFDADDHTYKVFGTNKGSNYNYYSNEAVDQYLTAARQTTDEEKRAEMYSKFQHALADDPAYSFLVYLDANYVAKSSITGISTSTVLGHHGVGIFWNIEQWDIKQ